MREAIALERDPDMGPVTVTQAGEECVALRRLARVAALMLERPEDYPAVARRETACAIREALEAGDELIGESECPTPGDGDVPSEECGADDLPWP